MNPASIQFVKTYLLKLLARVKNGTTTPNTKEISRKDLIGSDQKTAILSDDYLDPAPRKYLKPFYENLEENH